MGLVSANQFNLTPNVGGAIKQGLNLGEQFKSIQLKNKQQEFLEGGGLQDPNALQNAAKLGLDFQSQIAKGLGLQDDRTGQIDAARLTEAANFAFKAQGMPLEQQNIAINKRIEEVEARGGDATQTRELLNMPFEQRGKAFQGVQLAALPNEKRLNILTGSQAGTGEREFNNLISGFTDEEKQLARQIKAGLKPRAVGSAVQTITEEGIVEDIAGTEKTLSKSKEEGKLEAGLKLAPAIKSAVIAATSAANQEADIKTKGRSNGVALDVYRTGMKGLIDALGQTDTGPFVGLSPALTSNQQIADGAVAAMAPILKQIFRSAGEGTFTDSDQKLLTQMIPTRTDSKKAIASKLSNIDAIVRSKLSEGVNAEEPPGEVDEGVIMEDANGNRARVFKDGRIEEL